MSAPAHRPAGSPAPEHRDAISVVLADDSDRFRAGLVRALSRRPGVRLLAEAADGHAALALARSCRPDVLLLDDRMPGLTGIQVAEAVRRDDDLAATRVVMLTATDQPLFPARAAEVGVVTIIDKADSRTAICDAVEAAGR